MGDTTIRVSEALADELYKRKGRSNSYEDYIWELLAEVEGVEKRTDTVGRREEAGINTAIPIPEGPRDVLENLLDGSGDILDRRVDETLAMYDHLREEGAADKSDLLGAVDVEATGYKDKNFMWSNMVEGKLGKLPGVEAPHTNKSTWRYSGEELGEIFCPDEELGAVAESEPTRTQTSEEPGVDVATATPEAPRDVLDVAAIVREYFKTKHSPDPSSRTIHTRAAVADIVAYLRREGPTKPSTIRKAVYESHAEEWSDARTMWKSIGQKLYICGIPGVERSGEEWAYTGDAELIKQVE